jgi:phosphoserine phosphatase
MASIPPPAAPPASPVAPRPGRRISAEALEELLSITRHLAAPFELTTLLSEVAIAACKVLRAERGSVWLLDADAAELVLEISSDATQVRLPVGQGLVGACARERRAINVPDCYADPRFDASVDRRTGYRTRCSLTLPLFDLAGELVGVMQVLNRVRGVFDAADEALAEALAAQCAVALARARMTDELIEVAKLREQLEVARLVQTSGLPKALPDVSGYVMHATFRPAAETGGDTYDLALIDGRLLLLLADASGHGIGPALSVTQMQAMLRMAFRMGADLGGVFRAVNDQLADTLPDGHFVTAFIGLLDPSDHRLRFLSGGQAPILRYRAGADAFEAFKATSFPMGAAALGRQRAPVEVELEPGDWLVLLSDGVYEFENRDGEAFGRGRVEALVRSARGASPEVVAGSILEALRLFARGAPQDDDITMVLLRRLPTGALS